MLLIYLCYNIDTYIKEYNIYLLFKMVKYKLYSNIWLLLVEIHLLKNLLIYFKIELLV